MTRRPGAGNFRVYPIAPPGALLRNYNADMNIYGRPIRRFFQRAIERALAEVPPDIAGKIDNLAVVVEDRPDPADDPCGECLLGLFHGIALTERGMDYAGVMPDRISIYISSHLALQLDDADLKAEIRRTVLHEVGHHIGFDDDQLEKLGWG